MQFWTTEAKHALRTFFYAILIFTFAILLTFVDDWCIRTKRPKWLICGIECLSVWMFIVDTVVLIGIGVRIMSRAIRSLVDEIRR
jgi:hypothetical protein